MRFVHIADMHFDKPFTLLSNKKELGEVRRIEQRKAFKKMINYIKENKIPYLFIAGDLYEQEYIKQSTIEYINNLFGEIIETKIYIAPGNHDPYIKNSYYAQYKWKENVKILKPGIQKIEEKEFDLYGYGFSEFYCNESKIEEIKIENKNKINILLSHADINGNKQVEKQYNPISSKKIEEIGFEYVALGHIHKNNIEEKINIKYPGSMISMGFDEQGKHGMIVGEIEKEKINIKFEKLDEKEFEEKEIEISEIKTIEELIEKINEIEENKYIEIKLIGTRNFEINIGKIEKIIENQNIIKIKDNTKIKYKIEEIENKTTLKGIYAEEIIKIKQKAITEKEKRIIEKAIEIGMEVLS